ncbi:hypothetical protein KRX52_13170 [Pseudomonas sp. MAP12]|uniref:Uncharacterized protein n=1 Tax=Geopseudomonas aromaticivorans TaxID=2849492 RepID=A0ABS6MY33_9GAMM|nr:hypothetical protein [Pseudomonas aromaticivorans]MBV2133731.1 hypothetical protein [Pseudomonas aromaticivorans]
MNNQTQYSAGRLEKPNKIHKKSRANDPNTYKYNIKPMKANPPETESP